MENKIYPLNVGEHDPYPLKLKPKKHKPTFKEWIKDRKAMVIGVAVMAILTIAGILYQSGLGEKLMGLMIHGTPEAPMEIELAELIETDPDINLQLWTGERSLANGFLVDDKIKITFDTKNATVGDKKIDSVILFNLPDEKYSGDDGVNLGSIKTKNDPTIKELKTAGKFKLGFLGTLGQKEHPLLGETDWFYVYNKSTKIESASLEIGQTKCTIPPENCTYDLSDSEDIKLSFEVNQPSFKYKILTDNTENDSDGYVTLENNKLNLNASDSNNPTWSSSVPINDKIKNLTVGEHTIKLVVAPILTEQYEQFSDSNLPSFISVGHPDEKELKLTITSSQTNAPPIGSGFSKPLKPTIQNPINSDQLKTPIQIKKEDAGTAAKIAADTAAKIAADTAPPTLKSFKFTPLTINSTHSNIEISFEYLNIPIGYKPIIRIIKPFGAELDEQKSMNYKVFHTETLKGEWTWDGRSLNTSAEYVNDGEYIVFLGVTKDITKSSPYQEIGNPEIIVNLKQDPICDNGKDDDGDGLIDEQCGVTLPLNTGKKTADATITTSTADQSVLNILPTLSLSLIPSPESPQPAGTEILFKSKLETTGTGTSKTYTCAIDFGDQTSIETEDCPTKQDIEYTKHKYETVGDYTVKVTAKDNSTATIVANQSLTYKITAQEVKAADKPQCNNGIDDDSDGNIDYPNDKGCSGIDDITENSEAAAPKQCSDGLDNDNNGLKDYPADPGCDSAIDDTEKSTPPPPSTTTPPPPSTTTTTTTTSTNDTKKEICDNNKDDDGDKKIDYEDDDCKAPESAKIEISKVGVSSAKFNPEIKAVKVYYTINKDAHVVVDILDSKGTVIATLLDEDQDGATAKLPGKGDHTVFWEGTKDNKANGEKVADGTYTYKITANPKKYPTLKTSKEGTVTVDSKYVGQGDFEDINGGSTGTGTQVGTGTQGGTSTSGQGTLTTPITPTQMIATQTLQNATTGKSSGTGPEMWIYFVFPLFSTFAFAYSKIRKN